MLVSGRGSNLEAVLAAVGAGRLRGVEPVLVVSNRPAVPALAVARHHGVPSVVLERSAFPGAAERDAEIGRRVTAAGAELVLLAGYDQLLRQPYFDAYPGRTINIHPSLLPAFRGLDTHARALAAGVRVHGCSVHLVRPELDLGPILVQGVVPVIETDTAQSLGARVLELEHRCSPAALGLVASGRARVEAERIVVADGHRGERLLLHPMLAGSD